MESRKPIFKANVVRSKKGNPDSYVLCYVDDTFSDKIEFNSLDTMLWNQDDRLICNYVMQHYYFEYDESIRSDNKWYLNEIEFDCEDPREIYLSFWIMYAAKMLVQLDKIDEPKIDEPDINETQITEINGDIEDTNLEQCECECEDCVDIFDEESE